MNHDTRKRHVVSLEKMPQELIDAFNAKYPGGVQDCENDIVKYPKPNGDCFWAITLELPEDIYLVKIPVEIDSLDDVQKWLDREEESEIEQMTGSSDETAEGDSTIPDSDISQYETEDDKED